MDKNLKITDAVDENLKLVRDEDDTDTSLSLASENNGAKVTGDFEVSGYTDNIKLRSEAIVKGDGNATLDLAGDLTVDVAGGQFTIQDNSATDPDLIIKGTADHATSGTIQFKHERNGGDAGQDNDVVGQIMFFGNNDNTDLCEFARIDCSIEDASDGAELGELKLKVLSKESFGDLNIPSTPGLTLTGSSTASEVDATIGNGTASLTTIAGDLDIDGDTITSAGNLTIDCTNNLAFDANTGLFFFKDAGDADDYFKITVVGGTGATTLETLSDAADGHLTLDSDGDLILDSGTGKFIAKKAGTEFSASNSAYAGMILGYTDIGLNEADATLNLTTSYVVPTDEFSVSFVAPPSGNVEIFFQIGWDAGSSNVGDCYVGLSTANATSGYSALSAIHEVELMDGMSRGALRTIRHSWTITGLTAGASTEYWIGFRTSNTMGSPHIQWGSNATGEYPDFIMKATALPATIST